tara:strand:- start:1574 stop:1822 length:249 start_codon:yes stop_codon:yes gene_type:complete
MQKKLSYWLICPNRVEVQCFTINTIINSNNDEYIYIDQGIVMGTYGEKPPLMKTRKEMKINEARKYWQKLVTEGWQQTEPKW